MQEFLHENKTFTEPKLVHLDLETSSLCNLSCTMCPRPKENGTMPIEDIKRLIKEFADMGGETIKPFWRGEPTFDERMPEILKYAKDCGLKVMINTNGSDPKGIYKDCLPYIDWISFSIDEQHGNINNETAERILLADNQAQTYTEIQSSKHNIFIEAFCCHEKAYAVHYKVDLPTKRSDKDNTSEVMSGERKYCGFPSWRMVVAWNGDVTSCCVDWEMQNRIGNIYKQSLSEIFNGRIAEMLRNELKADIFQTNICKQCSSRKAYK